MFVLVKNKTGRGVQARIRPDRHTTTKNRAGGDDAVMKHMFFTIDFRATETEIKVMDLVVLDGEKTFFRTFSPPKLRLRSLELNRHL